MAIYLIPLAAVLLYIVTLVLYKKAKKKAEMSGTPEDAEKLKTMRVINIVIGITAAVLVVITVVLSALFFLFMMYM